MRFAPFSSLAQPHRLLGLALALGLVFGGYFSLSAPLVQAKAPVYGFAPQSYRSDYQYGAGIYYAPYSFTVYSQPNEQSPPLATFQWSHQTNGNSITVSKPNGDRSSAYADHVFVCFYPALDVAMLAVVGDNDHGWVEVIYDQAAKKTGWVPVKPEPKTDVVQAGNALPPLDVGEPDYFGVYQTWLSFMKLNAKASGIYWLSGVKEYNRSIRTSDADDAKLIPVTIIRDLKVRHARGNWLLVEVLDFEHNTPIGWVRWRDDNGNLMVFPNLAGQARPIVTTAY